MDGIANQGHVWVTITGGTHKGKEGKIVSHTPKYTKIDIGGMVIRCKQSFVTIVETAVVETAVVETAHVESPEIVPQPPVENITHMILDQNKEYELALAADLAKIANDAKFMKEKEEKVEAPVFEEVSVEEMRRVRLARFG
mgnify:CR=1 FL=1